MSELDRAIIDELIDHIEIGERIVIDGKRHQDIKVFYRFVGFVEGDKEMSDAITFNEKARKREKDML